MSNQIKLPKFNLGKVRAGVRPGKVQENDKVKKETQRYPKHRKKWHDIAWCD